MSREKIPKMRMFGEIIAEYRIAKGYTQFQLAKMLGYDTPQFVSLIERDRSKTPFYVIGQLVRILGIPGNTICQMIVDDYEDYVLAEVERGKKMVGK